MPPAEPSLADLAHEVGRQVQQRTYESGWKDGCRDTIRELKRLGVLTADGVERAQVILDRLEADGA